MIHQSRINVRIANAIMVILLFVFMGIFSIVTNGQTLNNELAVRYKNANSEIRISSEVSLSAKAVPLNHAINSGFDDIKPSVAPNGKRVYFSRFMHPLNTFGTADMEDIWYSEFDENTEAWSDPIRMTGLLNNAGPNFVNNVSVTGDTLILGNQYKKNGKMRAGLSYSVNQNGQWSFPVPIHIENDYNISEQSNSFVSLKNGVIIRAIERVETVGGRDLYVSFWNGEVATEPINMGASINSDLDESSPFLASDNKTLYFASKGHNGNGGYDIYMTRRLDDSWTNWSAPENLGPAVNGPMDDEFFSITHCGNHAIFSKQVSVHNTDLYRISMSELFERPINNNSLKGNSSMASL